MSYYEILFCYYRVNVIASIIVATPVKDFTGEFNYTGCLVSNGGSDDTPHLGIIAGVLFG